MDRRRLLVIPVLLLCCVAVWLLARGERDDRRPSGPTTRTTTAGTPTATDRRPVLAPPTERPTTPGPATEAGPATEGGTPGATERAPTPPGARLRGVRGRVVSAADGTPIAGAFVSWGAPPEKVLDAIRSSPALLQAGEGGEVTDGSGRFQLPRVDDDRPRFELFASAAGWLQASAVVGLREELELRLERAGRLAVRTRADEGPAAGEGGAQRRVWVVADGPGGAHHAHPWRAWPPVLEVAPGRWRVQVDGAPPVEVVVAAGSTTALELGAPLEVEVEGRVLGAERAPRSPGALEGAPPVLELLRVGELGSTAPAAARSEYALRLGEGFAFAGRLPPGVYSARVRLTVTGRSGEADDVSERAVLAPVRIAPPGPVTLELGLVPSAHVEVHVASGGFELPSALGLVGADVDPPDLVALPRSGEPRAAGEAVTQPFAGSAPPGRWSVFLGPTWAGDVELVEGAPATLALRPFEVAIRWTLPDALREGETLRGSLAVVPAELARRPIGARFREDAAQPFDAARGGEPYRLTVLAPGRYLLCGATDLGPFEREVELTGATEVEVELPAR